MDNPTLRDYQMAVVRRIILSFDKGEKSNPCVVAPTGAGKSWMIAGLIKECITRYPGTETRILVLTHQKELIEQDANALQSYFPEVEIGIYSASIKRKELDKKVTYASIQSLARSKENLKGKWHLIIIDEAHKVNANNGQYKDIIDRILPFSVIGFTATPFRLGQGGLTEGRERIFTKLIDSTNIKSLQEDGKLAYMKSKGSANEISMDGVKIVNGDFDKEEMNSKVDTYDNNDEVTDELTTNIKRFNIQHMLIFATSINHSETISQMMTEKSEGSYVFKSIDGSISKQERESLIDQFKKGTIKGLVNCEVLTTGFDFPDIDAVVMLRPTQSTALYAQMAGRGLRAKTTGGGKYGAGDCFLFDFVGNVKRHGVITDINFLDVGMGLKGSSGQIKKASQQKVRECPHCMEFIPMSRDLECPSCGRFLKPVDLNNGNVNENIIVKEKPIDSLSPDTYMVKEWKWSIKKTKAGDNCIVIYYITDSVMIMEWINAYSSNPYKANKGKTRLMGILGFMPKINEIFNIGRVIRHPKLIKAKKKNGFWDVSQIIWN